MKSEKVFVDNKEIILVGTAHISQESVDLAKRIIEEEKPDSVGVELDRQRMDQLLSGSKWKELDINKVIESGQTYLFLVNILLSNIQRQLGEKVGVMPGSEMLESVQKAQSLGLPVELLDRDVRTTFMRATSEMRFTEKLKFFYFLFMSFFGFSGETIDQKKIEEFKNTDLLNELMKQLGKSFPSIKKVLVDERDEFIAGRIMQSNSKKIVAVVGLGHVEGIKKALGKKIDLEKLSVVKKRTSILKILHYSVPVLFIAMLAYALFSKGLATSINIFVLWFLVHGVLSAIGVIIARGHLTSAAVAFIAAPFTALHPLLAAGWFAALAEAKIKNPKIKDFEELKNLNSLSDFSKNQVTRILLVAALANLGSTIATIIAFPAIAGIIA